MLSVPLHFLTVICNCFLKMNYMFILIALLLINLIGYEGVNLNHVNQKNGNSSKKNPKLIVLMLDAFRYDYLDLPGTIGLKKLTTTGARSKWVTPIFPSKTYPNMFTQVTGLYAEDHGVVDNNLFDRDHEELFYASGYNGNTTYVIDDEGSNAFWWNQSEPIWIAAEKNGYRTGIFYWQGCQVAFSGIRATFCEPYKALVDMDWEPYEELYTDVIKRIVFNITNDQWDLAMIYYGMIDATGHAHGIYSPQFRIAYSIADNLILKLLTLLELNGIRDTTNVVVLSDHGMQFKKDERTNPMVDLSLYLSSKEDFDPDMGSGTLVQLFPKNQDILREAYINLTREKIPGASVFLKEELPESFHLKNNNRTAPIIVLADPGYNLQFFKEPWLEMGLHGFDPKNLPEMRATFVATGPAFKSNFTSEKSMIMTDHYNVFCHVLKIKCHPNNGSFDRVSDLFS